MEGLKKPFQGVSNIVRFNWHFYLLALGSVATLAGVGARLDGFSRMFAVATAVAIGGATLISLLVSWYVYDLSRLYRLDWLDSVAIGPGGKMVNVHAGFDETSSVLRRRFRAAEWTVIDIYDPNRHTEISIRRARKAYPPPSDELRANAVDLPIAPASVDAVFVLFAAHEIRDEQERRAFFQELRRILVPEGKIVVLEHLRDGLNALAYTVGVFHFFSKNDWLASFERARLRIARKIKPNPFVTCFVLEKNGTTS